MFDFERSKPTYKILYQQIHINCNNINTGNLISITIIEKHQNIIYVVESRA